MNKIILITLTILLGLTIYFITRIQARPETQEARTVFVSQEECEAQSGGLCVFRSCDYVPPGKSFEEVCGKNFKKGWIPNQ